MDIMLNRILELIGNKHGEARKLAEKIGMPPNVVTDWKNGRLKSYPKYAPQIADYYNVSLDWLSGKTDIKKDAASIIADDTEKLKELDEIIKALSPEGAKDVLWFARSLVERERST